MVVELSEYRLADTAAIADAGRSCLTTESSVFRLTIGPMRLPAPCSRKFWIKKVSRRCPFLSDLLSMSVSRRLRSNPGDVVCISALPPYAFAPARAMCKQIRELSPKLKVVVCVWGFSGDTQKAMARFERTQPDRLSTSLAEAVEHVQELVLPKPEAAPLVA
jgi:hypothetical protein